MGVSRSHRLTLSFVMKLHKSIRLQGWEGDGGRVDQMVGSTDMFLTRGIFLPGGVIALRRGPYHLDLKLSAAYA